MEEAPRIVVQWLHVLGGIFWFGGVLFSNFVLVPAIMKMSPAGQQEFGLNISKTARIITPIAYATIVLGIIRGTVFGPIQDVGYLFGSAYGLTWLFALAMAIALIVYAQRVIEPLREQLGRASGDPAASAALMAKAPRIFGLELIMFFAVFTAMILMRFGL